MYHIANDARAKKSANLLVNATILLTNKKGFNEISIAELQRVSTVSRSTFYRLFDTPVDVLAYACDQMVATIAQQMPKTAALNLHNAQLFFIKSCMKQIELLRALAASDQTGLLRSAHQRELPSIIHHLKIDQHYSQANIDYINTILADLLSSAMFVWLEHGRQEDAESVYQQIKSSTQVLAALYQ